MVSRLFEPWKEANTVQRTYVCPYCGGRVRVEVRFRAERELQRGPVNAQLGRSVLGAICGLFVRGLRAGEAPDLRVGRVGRETAALLKAEGREDLAEALKPRKVGEVIRRVLGLETERSSEHGRARVVVWDVALIAELRERFGVDEEYLDEVVRILASQAGEGAATEG